MSQRKKLIRDSFRSRVFERDGHKCAFCQRTDQLDAHHIIDRNEMPNGGYVPENGITLCPDDHKRAEIFHETGKAVPGYHPSELFKLIGSSYETAVKAAKELR